jgi:predicted GIY-YIG superfamily endonuclease
VKVDRAPAAAGVYFFLSANRELLYVGKAGNLRSRLAQHAKGGGRLTGLYERAVDVRWEEHPSEHEAVCREADLLVALQPPYNASGSLGGWRWVEVEGDTFRCVAASAAELRYGCFPHLGPGQGSRPGVACTDGYPAVLRLLWAAAGGAPFPGVLGKGCPEQVTVPTADDLRRPLHDLLSGTSRRLLDLVAARLDHREPFEQPALRRDLVAACAFFDHGPAALRAVRRRHGLPAGPVSREQFTEAMRAEVRDLLGDDVVFPAPPDESLLGGRNARSLRHTT